MSTLRRLEWSEVGPREQRSKGYGWERNKTIRISSYVHVHVHLQTARRADGPGRRRAHRRCNFLRIQVA
ncbi:Protein of unknown function [Pyronema omphalodes CBS 100304]|uniref:Uncharacterized protein n=1 Tax=Pyronema omphalodes (strain CBS 100304) TaxID=1076935 RepID=U4LND4_PYROM|nr:Protein of unknown function [Pyronema omphalodes CBS 100304]